MYIVCNERKWYREYFIFKSTFVFLIDTGEKIKNMAKYQKWEETIKDEQVKSYNECASHYIE